MITEKQKKTAQTTFETLTRYLDKEELRYDVVCQDGEDYIVSLTIRGDDLPMEFLIVVNVERGIIMVKSREFTKFSEEKLNDAAKAVCALNYQLADGSYALDLETGAVWWTITSCFKGSLIGEEVIEHLIGMSVAVVDEYNEKFMMLNMGVLDLEGFLAII